jgi:RNA polymerase sigma-70 factor (ECF subfamily)
VGATLSVNTPDETLLHEFVNRNNIDAFGLIYEKYVKDVYRIVYMRVGKKSQAEDIVSDTFETLLKILENFRADSSLKTFIIGVAINKVRQYWQKSRADGLPLNEEVLIAEEDDEIDFEIAERSVAEAHELVSSVLGSLETPYGEVLKARFITGLSIRETAEKLNLSEANVRVIQHRALKKAADLIGTLNTNGKNRPG